MAFKIEFLTCDQASLAKRETVELRKMKQSWGVFVCLVERNEVRRLSLLSSIAPLAGGVRLVNIKDCVGLSAIALFK